MTAEQRLSAARMLWLRLGYALFILSWTAWAAHLSSHPSRAALAQLPLLGAYVAISVVALVLVRRVPRLLPRSWWLLLALDLPLIVASQLIALEYSTRRLARVEATIGSLFFLVAIAQLSLSRRLIFSVAIGAAAGHLALLHAIEFRSLLGRWLFTPVYFCAFGLIVAYLPLRLRAVLQRAVDARLQRERLVRFFSPSVAEQIQTEQEMAGAPRRFEVTVLFADLRGFTRASANFTPEDVARLTELHQTMMVEAVFRHGGTLDKFLGDGMLAYFGAPLAQPDHADRALRAATDLISALNERRAAAQTGALPILPVAIGLHSGEAVVGAVGPAVRREYTILGDVVNVASRIEGVAKQRGLELVVSEPTRALTKEPRSWEELPPAEIRGKEQSLRIFRLG